MSPRIAVASSRYSRVVGGLMLSSPTISASACCTSRQASAVSCRGGARWFPVGLEAGGGVALAEHLAPPSGVTNYSPSSYRHLRTDRNHHAHRALSRGTPSNIPSFMGIRAIRGANDDAQLAPDRQFSGTRTGSSVLDIGTRPGARFLSKRQTRNGTARVLRGRWWSCRSRGVGMRKERLAPCAARTRRFLTMTETRSSVTPHSAHERPEQP